MDHELSAIALAYVRCRCGWRWNCFDSTKGKTDEDLSAETYAAFEAHQADSLPVDGA